MNWNEYAQLLIGLIAVVNPGGAMPLFLSLTARKTPAERRRTAMVTAFAVAMVLFIALVGGEPILHFLGIRLSAFRVAGGVLLLLMGISMLRVSDDRSRHTPEENAESHDKSSVAVVPLAIPLLAGPGAISTTIVFAQRDLSLAHYLLFSAVIVSISLIVLVTLLLAQRIVIVMGQTGMNVVTRVMGLLLTSFAVEFIASGASELFPILAGG
ncbi:MAG: NAAT family transporter [Methylomonas sp.]|nr:NAAT family transporter [Methylomonas sp.]PPD22895.1 MAG: antibiotic resistance protein MarC [Methylomonas sp.]PPD27383.1 MAG: antibiotic resistance protein MarC [Methylomonas sp.]PPD39359.1 MAG: antibiotic resistance protein MarC [Methylomonas sp.]PPD41982.1 MAG: antibiotic resistance protein MarC [Methylomonas sp.]